MSVEYFVSRIARRRGMMIVDAGFNGRGRCSYIEPRNELSTSRFLVYFGQDTFWELHIKVSRRR
jgi:hypothetical protein